MALTNKTTTLDTIVESGGRDSWARLPTTYPTASCPSKAQEREAVHIDEAKDYTTFSKHQKRLLIALVGLGTITSPLTATMYFPLLPLLRTHFQTSAQSINLTLSVYIIFQAVSPAIFGPLSDSLGRRPAYLVTLAVYCAGNIGLALNRSSYAALIVLRALQSLGASATYAISYGVVADVCPPGDRGWMLGPVNMALNLGTCVGPIAGGTVAYKTKDYEWCFWALVILGFVLLTCTALFLPETARSLVGNGDGRENDHRYWSLWTACIRKASATNFWPSTNRDKERHMTASSSQFAAPPTSIMYRLRSTNMLKTLRILCYRDTALVLWMHGSFYVVDYSIVAASPEIYTSIYHLNELQVGLTYLTRGAGIIAGSYFNGKLMDHNYKVTATQVGWTRSRALTNGYMPFPFEAARSRGSLTLLAMSTASLLAYGWLVSKQIHIAAPLILQFVLGFATTCFYTLYSTLLVDSFPESPSTAAAAASIVRCAMAASGVAVLQPLVDVAGFGWYFTALALWSGICGTAGVLLIRRKGMKWRLLRSEMTASGNVA